MPIYSDRCQEWRSAVDRSGAARRKPSVALVRRHRILQGQLTALRREHDDLRHMIFEAAHLQRRLCGPRHLQRGSFEFAGEIFPVRHVSGDFIMVFNRSDELVFAIGDLQGKGLYAGMWFTHVVNMIRLHMAAQNDPANAIQAINSQLRSAEFTPLTTLFLAALNVHAGSLIYCNAGHPPSMILRRRGGVETLAEGGPVLGAVPTADFARGQTTLQPGDLLLAYSDGLVERCNESGAEFGTERLVTAVTESAVFSAPATLFSVLGAVEDFGGHRKREDDMALIVLRRAENQLVSGN